MVWYFTFCFSFSGDGWRGQGVLERGAILEIKLERGALKAKKGLERGAILELAGARSAEDKIGGPSLERQGQKGSERGALFNPGHQGGQCHITRYHLKGQ